jgi:2-polyprenyl-6-methoxyphenol hydroxylase-like FAD-dependent oxidoreductase
LSLVLRSGGNPQLLDSYEAERKPVDEAVIRQTDRATRLVSLHGTTARFIRDHMMSLLTQIPAVAKSSARDSRASRSFIGTVR